MENSDFLTTVSKITGINYAEKKKSFINHFGSDCSIHINCRSLYEYDGAIS
jgi:hypothetical protein